MGHEGLYSSTMKMDKLDKCKACSKHVQIIKFEENDIWKNIIEKIIQISGFNSDKEFRIYNEINKLYEKIKEENGIFIIKEEIDDNKTLKELIDNNIINIKKLIEIVPSDEPNNVIKIRLKKKEEEEEEDEKDEEDIGKKSDINNDNLDEIKENNNDYINLEEEIDEDNKKNTKKNKKNGNKLAKRKENNGKEEKYINRKRKKPK